MAMSSTHDRDFRPTTQTDTPDEGRAERGASPVLWALLILLLVAAPAWWWIRNSAENPAVVEDAMTSRPSEVMPAPVEQRQPAMVAKPSERSAPAIRDRVAAPLAGNPAPAYPPRALRSGVEGGLVARLSVDSSGNVGGVEIIERTGTRDRDLDRAVTSALQQWRFEPAMRDGKAVASTVQVPVDFKAQQ